ncbi:hypothetical protein ACFSKL_13005 [Belliella marina]|uniref:Uncharacterized protein n=1 Tax=Belliella marina TaxID=1644146 RepID=A0ABW4VSE1_9BACT
MKRNYKYIYSLYLKIALFACLLFLNSTFSLSQTQIDSYNAINGLELGAKLQDLKPELYLITGKESIYQNNEFLAKSYKRNLEKGMQEAIYEGNKMDVINGSKSSDTRLHFYKEELYKVRWTFKKNEFPFLRSIYSDFLSYFEKRLGPPNDMVFDDMVVWKGSLIRLQVFLDSESIQIELRDEKTETLTKQ